MHRIALMSLALSSRASTFAASHAVLRAATSPATSPLGPGASSGRGFRAMPPVMMGRRAAKIAGRKVALAPAEPSTSIR
jgi:hypothetical protein